MLPGALKTLPVYRVERTMESELFPALLEVYRCDLSSTFRGPGGYYEACKVYRAFLKHRKNPFRSSDGKKIQRLREYVAR
jgi:poly(A) polymerase